MVALNTVESRLTAHVEVSAAKRLALTKAERAMFEQLAQLFISANQAFGLFGVGMTLRWELKTGKWVVYPKLAKWTADTPSVTSNDDAKIRTIMANRPKAIAHVRDQLKALGFKVVKGTGSFTNTVAAKHPDIGLGVSFNWGRDTASGFEGWELNFTKPLDE